MTAGRPRKPEGTRQGHRQLTVVEATPVSARFVVPEPPLTNGGVTLLPEVLLRWDSYWLSVLPRALDGAAGIDRLVVDDWIRLENELLTLEQVIQSGSAWLVAGSMGQVRPNPLLGERHAIRQRLHDLRQQLGIGPKARAQLGIEVAGAVSAEARMNDALDRAARGEREPVDADVYDVPDAEDVPDNMRDTGTTRGRPRKWASETERKRAYRAAKAAKGTATA